MHSLLAFLPGSFFPTRCARLPWTCPGRASSGKAAKRRWFARQISDPFVRQAKEEGYRCRSAFKLLQMDSQFGLLRPGLRVVDCGAAPGSWSQVVVQRVNALGVQARPQGVVIGLDLSPIDALPGAIFLDHCDIHNAETQKRVQHFLPGNIADVILSDMAPNASGIRQLDQSNMMLLCYTVLALAESTLQPGGSFLCKLWNGADAGTLRRHVETLFKDVRQVKPLASRSESAEIYFVAREYCGQNKVI
uniref:rRNA methyltransferase 2, mitochondrial n=1 Tax=Eptatretus burgeri TaxID=7764 RepID=A0A8C4NK84_EPTBU